MTTKEAFEAYCRGRDPEDDIGEARALTHEHRMERAGLIRCDECRDWSSDTLPSVREVTLTDAGYAEQDVPVRCGTLCGQCREEQGALPEASF